MKNKKLFRTIYILQAMAVIAILYLSYVNLFH